MSSVWHVGGLGLTSSLLILQPKLHLFIPSVRAEAGWRLAVAEIMLVVPCSSPPLWQRHYVCHTAVDDSQNMLRPSRQSCLFLGRVLGAIVDAGDASLSSADVIDHRLDHVRRNAEIGHVGDDGAT